jgi:hypothetical protein
MRSSEPSRRSLWIRRGRVAPLTLVTVSAILVLSFGALGGVAASAAPRAAASTFTCSGADTKAGAGTLIGGTYASVTVNGGCLVNDGNVTVTGNLTIETSKGALIAAFAKNDHTGSGASRLTVDGTIVVDRGATLLLGCYAKSFGCVDDSKKNPTLNGPAFVHGSVIATDALGVITHDATIDGDAIVRGGGGGAFSGPGANCTPTGIFKGFGSPVYSDFEDSTIGGNVWVVGLQSCWYGTLRDKVGGSVSNVKNIMADPDSMEVLANKIRGNLICDGNFHGHKPGDQFGDDQSSGPNVVGGYAVGECGFSVLEPHPAPNDPAGSHNPAGPLQHLSVRSKSAQGYDIGSTDGGVFTFGAPFYGSVANPGTPYAGIATAPGGHGYWVANANAAVKAFGPNAQTPGSSNASFTTATPVVGIAAVPGGDGYWEAAADGGVFSSGRSAAFYGSAGGLKLVKPVVGLAAVPTGNGYDLVAADGGVFTYGPGAHFYGSTGNLKLNQPIVGMAIDPTTGGYWLVAADGGVFSFNAPYLGSLGNTHLNKPIVSIAAAPNGKGYYLVSSDGGVFAFGTGSHYQGSLAPTHSGAPVDGIALG